MKRNLMLSNRTLVKNVIACASIAAGVMFPLSSNAETTITAVLEAPLRALDPIVSTAYIIRNYGYMVYDTVLAEDAKGMPRPQMADWKVENGGKTYVFTLRDGLKFHDGKPVTATDTVASLKRWMQLDKMGQMLDGIMVNMKVVNDQTFSIELKQATDLPLRAMAKPSAVPAFVMPAAVAATPTSELITTSIGSGPFKFIASEYKPGVQAVFEKNKDYVPRAEAPDGMAGGKVVKVDKVKWVAMPDAMTALNALKAGEVDMVEQVAIDLLPMLENDKNLNLIPSSLRGGQTIMRFNFTLPGFDNKLIRQAAMMAVNQDSMMRAQIGDPKYYRTCGAVFGCDSKFASQAGAEQYFKGNAAKAKELLAQSGYKGETIVVMHPTDVQVGQVVPVIAQQLRNAGFKVRVDAVDWQTQQTRRASKRPIADGGWNIFVTYSSMPDVANPLGYVPVAANGDKAWFGWPMNPAVEAARKGYAMAANDAEAGKYAVELQQLLVDDGIVVPLGEYTIVSALNKSVKGFMNTPVPVFWNVSK